jgi:hypothetical protein
MRFRRCGVMQATIDPSQYTIIVPEATAISIYSRVDGAIRDRVTTSRWVRWNSSPGSV